jgi:hypothetical protein
LLQLTDWEVEFMNVDISPNVPPRSSCAATAPTGSGADGAAARHREGA